MGAEYMNKAEALQLLQGHKHGLLESRWVGGAGGRHGFKDKTSYDLVQFTMDGTKVKRTVIARVRNSTGEALAKLCDGHQMRYNDIGICQGAYHYMKRKEGQP